MHGIAIISRPIKLDENAYLLLEQQDGEYEFLELTQNMSFTLNKSDPTTKYCTGWYDIATHTNYICENHSTVDSKYESCFVCRQKTNFNPAFYNSADISAVQAAYNKQPHSVYIAYFGGGIAKAGIMSDSRKLERLYEQGALLYTIIESLPSAEAAHTLESSLIGKGLRNSVTKRQKEVQLNTVFNLEDEMKAFKKILDSLGHETAKIEQNIDHFFFDSYPKQQINPLKDQPISGSIVGVVGRYLVFNNSNRLYGFWLQELFGYSIQVTAEVELIASEPEQVSLF